MMEQELKDRQKRIEDKLDILLAAMSVHPEFGALVKQGKRELYKSEKSEEIKKRVEDWDNAKWSVAIRFLESLVGQNSALRYELLNIGNAMRSGIARINPAEVEAKQKEAVEKAIEDREGHPDLADFMDTRIGKPINFDEELKQIMDEYDRQQEVTSQNL